MNEIHPQTVTCPACQRHYPWQERYAGRKVRCKCGHEFKLERLPRLIDEEDDAPGTLQSVVPGSTDGYELNTD